MVTFNSTGDLAEVLRRAADAHHEYETRVGKDADWPTWYANFICAEASCDRSYRRRYSELEVIRREEDAA